MKRKLVCLLLTLLMALSLTVPVWAGVDMGSVYVAVNEMDTPALDQSKLDLDAAAEATGLDLHVDIVRSTEDETLEDYAAIFYDQYEYGYGDNRDGILLMILVTDFGETVDIEGFTLLGGGRGREVLQPGTELGLEYTLTQAIQDTLSGWGHTPEEAGDRCAQAVTSFAELTEQAAGGDGQATRDALVLIPDEDEAQTAEAEAPAAPLADTATGYVRDNAGLLSDSQRQTLEDRAKAISERYGCGIYILTVDDMEGYTDIQKFTEAYYHGNNLGLGNFRNGFMLTLSMAARDYDLLGYGRNPEDNYDYGPGILAFTDYGVDRMEEDILPDLRDNDYYDAFSTYLSTAERYLDLYEQGTPFDVGSQKSIMVPLLITLLAPLIIAGVVCAIFAGQMHTAKVATQADNYVPKGGFLLGRQIDQYTHSTQTRRHIERSSGSGGGTSVNSGGFSHSSGKF